MDQDVITQTRAAINEQRQDKEALALYWRYIQDDHKALELLPEAYSLLYTAWYQHGDDEIAVLIELAYQQRFADTDVLSFMAEGEFHYKRYGNALKLYDRLLTLKALDDKGYQHLKLACFRQQSFDNFTNLLLQRCLKLSPGDQSILRFLFSQYLLHDTFSYGPGAKTIYQALLELEPDNIAAHSALCECYLRQGKYEESIQAGEAALQYEKGHPEILANLAKAYYEVGSYGKVVNCCRDVLNKRHARHDVQILLATVYARNMLTTTESCKQYRLALNADPDNLPIRLALFRSYLRKLHVRDALEECEQIMMQLSEQYEESNRECIVTLKEMIAECERALRRCPDDIALYLVTAKLYEEIGHFNKALIYYRTLLEHPLEGPLLYKLIEVLEKLTSFQVKNPHLYLYLGLLYHKAERQREAKKAFRAVMFSDLDERDVDDILIRHDRSLWQYPPVLVILAHHRLVTKDILEGLVQVFRESDREDWKGVLWVLQELYDIDDLLPELQRSFAWESFSEIYQQIITLLAYNRTPYAIRLLQELLSSPQEAIRREALNALFQIDPESNGACLAEMSLDNPYADIRLEIAGYYAQEPSADATAQLLQMLHDDEAEIRIYVIRALQQRDISIQKFRERLFIEQNVDVKIEIIRFLSRLRDPKEVIYLAHLLNDLVTKRYEGSKHPGGNVYSRLKELITHTHSSEEDVHLLSALIDAVGKLRLDESLYSLSTLAEHERSQILRIKAIEALGQIGSARGIPSLQKILHSTLESQDIRAAAEKALDLLMRENPL
ncbi:hypothetical protein CSB45_01215 [candidate division KSB3 bacterium]|uniref:Tetratricopeptide repeat protein n=1 Tax=candidate division KSB3 bacterium TaxID=2044937 RepID=A0A2G6EAE2_9BACT|nr:MAG: hypothetical protein CSB45_01215 [candidate division KSB3 bacterium]PIE30782.1 MAG: hypothetical protein CSA57_02135 [candidate division KSB3 bacterium]